MLHDPRYNNMVKDISELLMKHDEEHYANLLPEAVNETVVACADSIKQIPLGERTAEKLAEIMKEHFYGAARQHKLAVDHEMSAEFYRRVYDAMTKNTGSE